MSSIELLCCEPCKYRGVTSSAVTFCESCQEQLCKACADFHKSFKATRDHKLVENKESVTLCLDMDIFRLCKEHANKQTEFYCCSHDTLLCSLCLLKSKDHRNCINEIVEIETVGKSLVDSKFTDMAREKFQDILLCAHRTLKEMKEARNKTNMDTEAVKREADALRSKFIETFDRQIQRVVKTAVKMNKDKDDQYEKTIQTLDCVIKEAEENEKTFETILATGRHEDIFRCLLSVGSQMEDFKTEAERICKGDYKHEMVVMVKSDFMKQLEVHEKLLIDFHIKSSKLRFSSTFPNKGFQENFKSKISSFVNKAKKKTQNVQGETKEVFPSAVSHKGELKTMTGQNKQTTEADCKPSHSSDMLQHSSDEAEEQTKNTRKISTCQQELATDYDIELRHGYSFSVTLPDGKTPWFGGIAVLPNEKLVLSDFNNSRLIILDSDNQVLLTKSLKYEPGNITLINSSSLAVCLMKTNQILLMDITNDSLREKKYLQTKYHPKCVQVVAGKMLVSCEDAKGDWDLNIMTVDGSICRKIQHHRMLDGYRIAIQTLCDDDSEEFRIIQSCEITNNVQCFGSDGSFVFDYGVERCMGVVTDSNKYIFIIRYSGEVQVLSPNGHYLLRLHSKNMSKSKFAAFNQAMDKLYITTYKEPKIHVLNVERKARQ